jgi:AraC-like DNA-binding protein
LDTQKTRMSGAKRRSRRCDIGACGFPHKSVQRNGITDWRLREAARRRRATDAPLAEVVAAVGYASPAAFARAFKRAHVAAPGRWRTAQAAAA